MSVLNTMIKYVGYYIVMMILIALFTGTTAQMILTKLCEAALSIAMFSAVMELLLDERTGAIAHRISDWCMKCCIAAVFIAVVSEIGIMNIFGLVRLL